MLYQLYQAQTDMLAPARFMSGVTRDWIGLFPIVAKEFEPVRHLAAFSDLIAQTKLTHSRPAFGIDEVEVDGRVVTVVEQAELVTPFGTLLNFRKDVTTPQPKILLVAPMACHFATLLRETVRTLLPEHDVYITDWHNVRDVPLSDGQFDLDDYIEHLIQFLDHLGPGVNLMGICQPCPAALAAVALMSEDGHPATPRTLSLLAGPVDTRQNPTLVNERATSHSLRWFEKRVTDRVPFRYAGAGRKVYPGFLQIAGFTGMNFKRHQKSLYEMYCARVARDSAKANPIQDFYEEYFAVCDLPAEFYLQTMERIFQEHHLPQGRFEWRGRRVNPAAIRNTALLTIEGGRDDICGLGQTHAAQALCTNLSADMKTEHVEPEAGHYGVFSGSRWSENVYPIIHDLIRRHA